eukprot:g23477.t1
MARTGLAHAAEEAGIVTDESCGQHLPQGRLDPVLGRVPLLLEEQALDGIDNAWPQAFLTASLGNLLLPNLLAMKGFWAPPTRLLSITFSCGLAFQAGHQAPSQNNPGDSLGLKLRNGRGGLEVKRRQQIGETAAAELWSKSIHQGCLTADGQLDVESCAHQLVRVRKQRRHTELGEEVECLFLAERADGSVLAERYLSLLGAHPELVSRTTLCHPGKSLAMLWSANSSVLQQLCGSVPKETMQSMLPVFFREVSYRQFIDVLVPLLEDVQLLPQVSAMLMSLGASAAMLVVLNRAPKGKLSIVLKAPVEVLVPAVAAMTPGSAEEVLVPVLQDQLLGWSCRLPRARWCQHEET